MVATRKQWKSPEILELGDAKDLVKGFTDADPKRSGGGDDDLDVGSDV